MAYTGKKSEYLDEVLRLYSEGCSIAEVKRKTGVSEVTVSRWLREAGVEIEYRRPERVEGAWEQRTCPQDQKVFSVRKLDRQTYCSVGCANDAKAGKAQVCPCGKDVPYEKRHTSLYCSPECRALYGKKRQRDPAKWRTLTCQNEACGKEFEQRTSSQSYGKFCSNACAYRHTKTKQHLAVGDVVLDSGWEALFWGLMAFLKVPCERCDREQGVEWSEGHWYAPDFLVAVDGLQIGVEVKGVEDEHDQIRWGAWRGAHGPLVVLDRAILEDLRGATAQVVRQSLYLWARS